jgi:hypothetical protein
MVDWVDVAVEMALEIELEGEGLGDIRKAANNATGVNRLIAYARNRIATHLSETKPPR